MLWFTQKVLRRIPGAWTFVMVTDRTELDDQLHGEFADAGAISREAKVHADVRRAPARAARRGPPLRVHADPQVPPRHGGRRDDDAGAVGPLRRHRHHRRGAPQPVRHPRAEHAPGAAERLVHGLHRHAADRRRGADPRAVRRLRLHLQLPRRHRGRRHRPAVLREPHPRAAARQRGLRRRARRDLLEEAELDEDAEGQLARRFGRQYTLITRPERLRTVAEDLVAHFVGRGFAGKAMYVGIDKAAAVRMYDFVREAWAEHLAELRAQHDALPELERPWLASRIELMETTDMAVVVSQARTRSPTLDEQGLDIRPHRERMISEDLDEKFKDAGRSAAARVRLRDVDDRLRRAERVDDLPRPADAQPHADADDRPRQPGLPRQGQRADRRLHRRVPEPREGARDLRCRERRGRRRPRSRTSTRSSPALDGAVDAVVEFCARPRTSTSIALRDAKGFALIALRDAAVESAARRRGDPHRRSWPPPGTSASCSRPCCPTPRPPRSSTTVAAIRVLAERIATSRGRPQADLDAISDAVDALLDRSVGAEEYVIRAAAEGSEPDPLIDLSQIDFDGLAAKFAGRKRAETDRLAALLKQRAVAAATRNPTRYDLVERIEELIADYNAGSLNIDEYLRRLIELSKTLTDEEQRAVTEGLTEEELAIFDLLTKPEPVLTDAERDVGEGQRQAAARAPARQARAGLAPQGGHDRRRPRHDPRHPRRRPARGSVPAGDLRRQGAGRLRPRRHGLRRRRIKRLRR